MKSLRSENEIISSWKQDKGVAVSVSCTTFNQDIYIEDAIKGFLNQETSFPFEILIHDDASTDKTAEIIRKYEKKYPRIIKAIFQTENQYSKKVCINSKFNFSRAKGKYIAICEGDDYWTSHDKLQKQFEFMEENKNFSFTFHNAYVHYQGTNTINLFNSNLKKGCYTTKDLFIRDWFIPTASLFMRKKSLDILPDWIGTVRSIDLVFEIIASTKGDFWYDDEAQSVYRKNAIGSISSLKERPWLFLNYRIKMMKLLFLELPLKYKVFIIFDIFKSFLKINYSKIKTVINNAN